MIKSDYICHLAHLSFKSDQPKIRVRTRLVAVIVSGDKYYFLDYRSDKNYQRYFGCYRRDYRRYFGLGQP